MATDYVTEDLIAGVIRTDQVNLKADTYYRGMPLKWTEGSSYFEYSATGSEVQAVFMEEERTLSDAGYGSVIVSGSEVYEGGIVDDSGNALTITDDFIADVALNGITVKRT